jgi:fatty-acyl-CoA synthase
MELPDVGEKSPALILSISGTTGRPKGVLLSHRNMEVQAITCIQAMEIFDDSDIGFLTAPFFHLAGLGSIVAHVLVGGTVVIRPLGAFDPTAVLDAYEREGATVARCSPFGLLTKPRGRCYVRPVGDLDHGHRVAPGTTVTS